MWEYIVSRIRLEAEYIVQTGSTVRATAAYFNISKSTVHKDVTERLKKVNPALFSSVRDVLEKNKSERHLRGGDATRIMYLSRKIKNATKNEYIR